MFYSLLQNVIFNSDIILTRHIFIEIRNEYFRIFRKKKYQKIYFPHPDTTSYTEIIAIVSSCSIKSTIFYLFKKDNSLCRHQASESSCSKLSRARLYTSKSKLQ